jgi:uncharacterized protein YciI
MYFLLFYKTVDNYVERRKPYRDEHLGYAEAAHGRGEVLMAGALGEPADSAASNTVMIDHPPEGMAADPDVLAVARLNRISGLAVV